MKIFKSQRFSSISDIIDIKKLEHESRKFLYLGFVVAILVHIMAGIYLSYRLSQSRYRIAEKKYREPIPVDIIILPPRIRNPYETWIKIILQKVYGRKEFVQRFPGGEIPTKQPLPFEAPGDDYYKYIDTDALIQALLDADIPDSIKALIDPEQFVIEQIYKYLTTTREPGRQFSLEDEMLTLDDIDELGIYKGFVVMDPEVKQNIKGFLYIPKTVREMRLSPSRSYNLTGSVEGLAEAFNFYTGMNLKVDAPVSLGSPNLFNYPVVYLTATSMKTFRLSSYSAKNFGKYLRNGGFAIIDNGRPWHEFYPAEASLLNILLDSLGEDFRLERIPQDHPVYHCFFDFNGLPPDGAENWSSTQEYRRIGKIKKGDDTVPVIPDLGKLLHVPELNALRIKISKSPLALWGAWIDEQLVAIYSDKGYGHFWHDGVIGYKHRDFASGSGEKYDFNPQLKIGVNMVVFALIQKEGITKQLVDYNAHRRK